MWGELAVGFSGVGDCVVGWCVEWLGLSVKRGMGV